MNKNKNNNVYKKYLEEKNAIKSLEEEIKERKKQLDAKAEELYDTIKNQGDDYKGFTDEDGTPYKVVAKLDYKGVFPALIGNINDTDIVSDKVFNLLNKLKRADILNNHFVVSIKTNNKKDVEKSLNILKKTIEDINKKLKSDIAIGQYRGEIHHKTLSSFLATMFESENLPDELRTELLNVFDVNVKKNITVTKQGNKKEKVEF